MATLRQLAASLSESGKGLYSAGLEEFDRLRIRLSPGQFIVVGGRPGMGKTYFLLFLISPTPTVTRNSPASPAR